MTQADVFTHLRSKTAEKFAKLDTFPAPPHVRVVTLESSELTSFCPVTFQPDFNDVEVVYHVRDTCIETKSFKLYLQSFRDKHDFGEALASQIAADVSNATKARLVVVTLKQHTRGGVQMTVQAEVHTP
jgi:7-cyano-7-deazaguanine reductase